MSKTKIFKTLTMLLLSFGIVFALITLSACNKDSRHTLSADDITITQQEIVYNGNAQKPEIVVKSKNRTYEQDVDYAVFYENNTNAGMAKLIVSAIDSSKKLKGRVEKNFKIEKLDINNLSIKAYDLTFSGNPTVLPQISITLGQKEISKNEFNFSQIGGYPDTENFLTISSKENSNFVGSKQIPYVVNFLKLEDCFVQIEKTIYDGTAKTPNFVITHNNENIPQSVLNSFNITFENNILASDEAKLTLKVLGQNHYFAQNDQTEVLFRINKADLSSSQIAQIEDKQYDGTQAFKIEPEVVMFNKTLKKDVDYEVKYYRDNTEIFENSSFVDGGTIKVLIVGKQNFEGEKETSYFIKGIDRTQDPNLLVEITDDNLIFSDYEQIPQIKITYLGNEIYSYQTTFLNNINAGENTATAIINFEGNFAGTLEKTFSIKPRNINEFLLTLNKTSSTFLPSGAEIDVELKEYDQALPLVFNRDFSLSYEDNTIVSTPSQKAKVKAIGINNYCGETNFAEFDVLAAEITQENIAGFTNNFLFDGTEKKPNIKILISNQEVLSENFDVLYYSDYESKTPQTDFVSANQTIYVEIVPKNNICANENIVLPYTISVAELTTANTTITLSENEFLFDGTAKTPTISSILLNDLNLDDENFDVSFENNTNAGNARAIISGKKNVFGTIVKEFTILQKELLPEMITFKEDSTYNNQTKNLTPSVFDALLTENDYYTNYYKFTNNEFVQIGISEINNIKNAGTYKVEVVGQQNYTGTVSKQTIIKKAENILTNELEIKNWQYGTNQVFPKMIASFGTAEFYYSKLNEFNYLETVPTEIGSYSLKGVIPESENYFEIVSYCNFEITKANLENAEILISEITLNDNNVENLSANVFVGQKLLTSDDYALSFVQNGNILTVTVIAKPDSTNVYGTKEQTFNIKNAQTITINCENSYNYGDGVFVSATTFSNQTVNIKIYKKTQTNSIEVLNGTALNAGNYFVVARSDENDENFKAITTKEFVVLPKQYEADDFSLTGFDELSYSGQNVLLNSSIYDKTLERTLEENKDYTLNILGDMISGTTSTSVTINFVGNYSGSVVKNIEIGKKILFGGEQISTPFTGSEVVPKVCVFNQTFVEGTNYDVVLYSNKERSVLANSTDKTNVGTIFGVIKAKNKEFDDVLFELNITKQNNAFNEEFYVQNFEFGETITKPSITSKFGETKIYYALFNTETKVLGEFLEWTDSQKPTSFGKYYVKAVVEETNNYFGLQTETIFEITKQEIKKENITLSFGGNNYGADDMINITYQEGIAQNKSRL